MIPLLALLIGVVAGLRALTAPTAVSWAAASGALDRGQSFQFMGYWLTPWVLGPLAAFELFNDKRPSTPSRKVPPQFAARLLLGGLSGATIGAGGGMLFFGLVLGAIGAVAGTLGGAAARARLAARFGRDRPAALIEDAIAIGLAAVVAMIWSGLR